MYAGLGLQRPISVLSACFHAVWSRPSSLLACSGSGCLIAASYSARSSLFQVEGWHHFNGNADLLFWRFGELRVRERVVCGSCS